MTHPEDVVPAESIDFDERPLEAPDADVAERVMTAGYQPTASDSLEAPQWDAHEQAQIVEYDDDYR